MNDFFEKLRIEFEKLDVSFNNALISYDSNGNKILTDLGKIVICFCAYSLFINFVNNNKDFICDFIRAWYGLPQNTFK